MEPIISPWLVYAIGQVNTVKVGFELLAFVSGGTVLGGLIFWFMNHGFGDIWGEGHKKTLEYEARIRAGKRCARYAVIPFCLFVLLSAFTPNRNTLVAVIVSTQATPDNISTVMGAGKSFKDEVKQDILDILEHGIEQKKERAQ